MCYHKDSQICLKRENKNPNIGSCINPSGVNAAIVKQQSHVTCTLMCEGVQRWCIPATDRDGKAEPSCRAAAEEGARRSRTLSHPGANE